MAACINKNHPEYQTLKRRSGILDELLEAQCFSFMNKYGRFPYLDEIRGSHSENNLKEQLNVTKDNVVKINDIFKKLNVDNVEDANSSINDQYRDLEVKITPIVKEAFIDIKARPTMQNFNPKEVVVDSNPNSYLVFNNAIYKLGLLYGIKFKTVNDIIVLSLGFDANAFIYNGDIYINVDRANVDAPLHEMMHILIGSMRFTNPNLYLQLVGSAENFSNYLHLSKGFQGRTRNDINEEVFVTEVARHVMGMPSALDNMTKKTLYEILYNIKRTLDSVLMGEHSVKGITDDILYTSSFKDIAQMVQSSIMTNNYKGTLNVEGSELHRRLNNIKSDLLKNRILEEVCN